MANSGAGLFDGWVELRIHKKPGGKRVFNYWKYNKNVHANCIIFSKITWSVFKVGFYNNILE